MRHKHTWFTGKKTITCHHITKNLNKQTGPTCVHRLALYLDRGQHFAAVQEVKVVYITAVITGWATVVLVDERRQFVGSTLHFYSLLLGVWRFKIPNFRKLLIDTFHSKHVQFWWKNYNKLWTSNFNIVVVLYKLSFLYLPLTPISSLLS